MRFYHPPDPSSLDSVQIMWFLYPMADAPKSTRDTYHHGSLKEAALEQGIGLLREVGTEKFSLREVARRVGVTPTALYHHFPDKNDLIAELAEIGLSRFRALFETPTDPGESPSDRLLRLAYAYLDFFEERPFFLDIMFAPTFEEYPNVRNVRSGLFLLLLENLRQIGVPEEDVAHVALWCWSAVHGLAALTKADVFGHAAPEECADPGQKAVFHETPHNLRRDALPVLIRMIESYAKDRLSKS
jgi:AcrR family transcriptional regulator